MKSFCNPVAQNLFDQVHAAAPMRHTHRVENVGDLTGHHSAKLDLIGRHGLGRQFTKQVGTKFCASHSATRGLFDLHSEGRTDRTAGKPEIDCRLANPGCLRHLLRAAEVVYCPLKR